MRFSRRSGVPWRAGRDGPGFPIKRSLRAAGGGRRGRNLRHDGAGPTVAKLARREMRPLQEGLGRRPRPARDERVEPGFPRSARCLPGVELFGAGRCLSPVRRRTGARQRHGRAGDERRNGEHLSTLFLFPMRQGNASPGSGRPKARRVERTVSGSRGRARSFAANETCDQPPARPLTRTVTRSAWPAASTTAMVEKPSPSGRQSDSWAKGRLATGRPSTSQR